MQTVKTVPELRHAIRVWRLAGESIAFVPTMGNLHEGHLKLVTVARQKADKVVASIFINPTQFGVGEDFATYPRTELEDQDKLNAANTDLLFLPAVPEVYAEDANTVVTVTGLSELYCGASRPGHFNGVATVVCKLFNMVQPDIALFGLKDFQQLTVIRAMVRDLNIPVEIAGVETVREADGLAMSSRNSYLTAEERVTAPKLYEALCAARVAILSGNRSYAEIEQNAWLFLQKFGFQPDYFCVCRSQDLKKAEVDDSDLVLLAAAKLGKTRLIDNLCFSIGNR
ncbi:MAG: pantoate--beta-alanine ligase [Methylobacter sp.]|nr:pantoate--beta-alanine ligase [Methylobacter sp.]